MLKQINLKNWKSFKDATLYIDPLTILIGTNSSGKSNIIDALDFLSRIPEAKSLESALMGDSHTPGIRGGLEWVVRKPETQFTLEAVISGEYEQEDEQVEFDCLYTVTTEIEPKIQLINEFIKLLKSNENKNSNNSSENTISSIGSYLNFSLGGIKITPGKYEFPALNTLFPRTKFLLGDLKSLPVYDCDSLRTMKLSHNTTAKVIKKIFIINPIPQNMRDYSPLSKTLEQDGSNIAGVLAALPEPEKEKIEQTLLNYLSQLPEGDLQRVWAEPVGRLGSDAMLYCEEKWGKNQEPLLVDARGMSDGTLRFLAILTALLTRPEGSLIVIEEVDNGLHPSRAGLLLQMLREIGKKRNIDILVTTHNPALMDELTPDFIPFVMVVYRDQDTGESQLIPLDEIENLPKLIASGSLGKITQQGLLEKSLAEHREYQ
ncbi:AAA family ATPase [Planktothrix sp. FACHB-1365]|uniref:AAA family ATPase n=1 Tax=Planktothrix sp. FACHB-1365 TaxID=2692855 RepID=UPI001685EE4E|nr:ATP-binding protein [Planktothrix sp. FACHB-1365]MBD2480862.1 AAA family ATPase [Planktothrix sp. FACHB-1365]